jgi:RNA polymerase sigma-70 factor (ECF subfamily)
LIDHQRNFADLLREHAGLIARIAASYEADRELARDLTQEILLAIWRALPVFRKESSQRTFIARIAHNRAISHVARRANLPAMVQISEELACPLPVPEAVVLEEHQSARLLAAVQRLPLSYRQVASLLLEDFTPAEIAQILGLSVNAVTIRSSRARALLRDLLGEPT